MSQNDITMVMVVAITIILILMVTAWLFWPGLPKRKPRDPSEHGDGIWRGPEWSDEP